VVAPNDGGERGKPLRVDATLDGDDKTGATVLLKADDEFTEGKPYVLDAIGVKDRSAKANLVDEKSATNRAFEYVNTLPPRLNEIVATGGRFEIKLVFGSALEAKSAQDAASYALTGPDGRSLRVARVDLPAPGEVLVRLVPTRLTEGPHQLRIEKLIGRNHIALDAPIDRGFSFNDRPKAPGVDKAELASSTRLRLTFDRAVAADTANAQANYRVLDRDGRSTDIAVKSAEAASDDATRIVLVLSRAPTGGKYYVETSGLTDVFGTKQEAPARYAFEVKGSGDIVFSLISWAEPPALRDGGRTLVLAIRGRLREAEAKDVANYELDPAPKNAARVDSVKVADGDERLTTVTLRFAEPIRPPLRVAAHGLVLQAAPGRGGQTLPAQDAL